MLGGQYEDKAEPKVKCARPIDMLSQTTADPRNMIPDHKTPRTHGQRDRGRMDRRLRTYGHMDIWTYGHMDIWT